MSKYTVYNLAVDVQKKLHGGTINDLESSLDEGRRNMLRSVSPPEMVRSAYLEQAIYDRVERYAVAEDLKYDEVIDIKKLSCYRNLDTLEHPLEYVFRRQFNEKRHGAKNVFAIANQDGVKYAMIYHPKGLKHFSSFVMNAANSLSDNGTWNVGGNVVNLRLDKVNHVTKGASIKFDINNSSNTGFINNLTMTPVDISEYLEKGAEFTWLNIPLPLEMISVEILMGSDVTDLATDYYYATVNQPHDNNQFTTGWNLLKYMLPEISSVGTPNPKAISWIQLNFTTTGNVIPGCNIDSFIVRKGEVYEYVYNSQYCLRDSVTGAWKQKTTSNSDIIVAEEDTYQILMLETALVEQEYLYANNFGSGADVTAIKAKLFDAYSQYKLDHTDEMLMPSEWSYCGGNMYDGYESDGEDNSSYSDWDNNGDVGSNTNNNNWP